jgi:hypothetical protein
VSSAPRSVFDVLQTGEPVLDGAQTMHLIERRQRPHRRPEPSVVRLHQALRPDDAVPMSGKEVPEAMARTQQIRTHLHAPHEVAPRLVCPCCLRPRTRGSTLAIAGGRERRVGGT